MLDLLTFHKEQTNITKEEFLEDIDVLFLELKKSYAGYEYFKAENFLAAKEQILLKANENYDYKALKQYTKDTLLSFIKDGCFYFGFSKSSKKEKKYEYAYRRSKLFGLDYLDVKKLYYTSHGEKGQLEDFVSYAIKLRKKDSFIIDLRDTRGDFHQYIYNFIYHLFESHPDYPVRGTYKCSNILHISENKIQTMILSIEGHF